LYSEDQVKYCIVDKIVEDITEILWWEISYGKV
jgi:hypothetical protein